MAGTLESMCQRPDRRAHPYAGRMSDALSMLLDDVRPRGALFDRSYLTAPWAFRVTEAAPLTVLALLDGDEAWVTPDDGAPQRLGPGDVAVVVGRRPYTVGGTAATAPRFEVGEANHCTLAPGEDADGPALCTYTPPPGPAPAGDPGTATAGRADGRPGAATVLKGTYEVHESVCDQVLRDLPPVVVVPAGSAGHPILPLVVAELSAERPGRQALLDRLLGLLLVSTLREWLDTPGSGAPAWYGAQADPIVGVALRLMHDEPARPWTVAALAAEAGVSRATLARRFTDLVGEPPMAHLACWRICLAADLLRETDDTVGAIARKVGYADAFALSVAFKRVHGVRPTEHRASA